MDLNNIEESSSIEFKIAKHIRNRQKIKQMYQDKGIQMLNKPEKLISEIQDPQNELSSNYEQMKKELSEKGFDEFRYLGKGAQGLVVLAKESQTNKRYAIKGIKCRDERDIYQEDLDQVNKEIDILLKCRGSPYVVNLLEQFEGKMFKYLVLNECQGTLNEIIQQTKDKKLNELSAIKYSKDIAEGLYFIHSKNCLVNDLKMDNILIDYNGNAVICDFGFAEILQKQSEYSLAKYQGNTMFQAPECYGPNDFQKTNDFDSYISEYQKLNVDVKQEPSQRSEACSLGTQPHINPSLMRLLFVSKGYIIYTLIFGVNTNIIFSKHKPIQYEDEFQAFKYQKQLQFIIDGLTQFIPRQRLQINDALIILKGIISQEFQLEKKFIDQIEDNNGEVHKFLNDQNKEVQFVQSFSNKLYPIIKNEQTFLSEIEKSQIKQVQQQEEIIADLNQKNSQLKQEFERQKDNQERLQNELKDKEIQNSNLQSINNFQEQLIQKQEVEKDELKEQNFLLKYQFKEKELKLQSELEEKLKQIDDISLQKQSLDQQIQNQKKKIDEMNQKLSLSTKQFEEKEQKLQSELEEKLSQIKNFSSQNQNQYQEIKKQEKIIEEMNQKISLVSKEFEQSQEKYQNQLNQNQNLNQTIQSIQSQNDSQKQQIIKQERIIEEQNRINYMMKEQIEKLREKEKKEINARLRQQNQFIVWIFV